ncbi:MAG: polysaccharide deacetylase family protein [Thermodesulfovibrionia bacterium]|nr:polysaccharide deacetylase family protein [Thermodesulfovibrionia bacterium]
MNRFIYFAFILFLISSCGGVSTKNSSSINKSEPLVTFVFDDGNETDYTVAKNIFSARGEVACSAVTTNWINGKGYLTVPQLMELQNAGWEILSHTESHPNLRDLSGSQIETELSQSKAALENWGLPVRNLVYPYNGNNEAVKSIAEKYYRSARSGHKMLNSPDLDRYNLKAFSSELSTRHKNSRIKSQIDRAYSEKKWLILYHHLIDAKIKISDKSGAFIPEERLSFMPSGATGKYIKDNGSVIQFIPLSGSPHIGDIVAGQSSGAVSRLERIYYNEREAIIEMIEYIHKNYPDMRIVTIDKGLDLMGIP